VWQQTGADGAALPTGPAEPVGPGGALESPAANGSLYGIYACGPMPTSNTTGDFGDPPFEYWDGESGSANWAAFQCVELANRFLWDLWHKAPVSGGNLDGADFATTVADTYGVALDPNGVAGDPYLPGDIVSFNGDGGLGHVAVVISSSYTSADSSTGDYWVTIEDENATGTISTSQPAGLGTQAVQVTDWSLQSPAGQSGITASDFAVIPQDLTPSQVSLGRLCDNKNVQIDAQNGCPYKGAATIGSAKFQYVILIVDNDDSVYPSYWDLINFPATSCQSVQLSFGMPKSGSDPGDTAWIEVVTKAGAQSLRVKYGQVATLTATLYGDAWSLENSATNANDEIAVNGTGSCSTSSGY
jgi:CHAP domain